MKTKKDYLVETSAVPVAIGQSTPNHCRDFANATADGGYCTSIYIRKEFIRRWICDYIDLAFLVDHYQTLDAAIFHLEQEFKPRTLKTGLQGLAAMLQQKGAVRNTRDMAKEFARLAVASLRFFDRKLKSCTRNSCRCQIGGKQLKVDFNTILDDLRAFVESVGCVEDCPVNDFLDLGRLGKASKLLEKEGVVETTAGKNLAALHERSEWITCRECATIGDTIIAIEQPRSCCLVHIDHAFDALCAATEREHKRIPSQRASEKAARNAE
jgi:hypothetical protein